MILEIKIKSTSIRISFWFSMTITVLLLLDEENTFFLAFISALCHELGHIIVIVLQKNAPKLIEFTPFGLRMTYIQKELSYKKEIQAALFGPLVNIIIFIVCYVFDLNKDLQNINLALAIFNLLPISELDGGRICYLLIASLKNPTIAKKVKQILDFIFLVLSFSILFLESMAGIFNYSYFLFTFYLGCLTFFNNGLFNGWNNKIKTGSSAI